MLHLCMQANPSWIRLYGNGREQVHMDLKPVKDKPDHYEVKIGFAEEDIDFSRTDGHMEYFKMFKGGTELKITKEDLELTIESSEMNRTYTYEIHQAQYLFEEEHPTECPSVSST